MSLNGIGLSANQFGQETGQHSAARQQTPLDPAHTPHGERSAAATGGRNREAWASQEEYN